MSFEENIKQIKGKNYHYLYLYEGRKEKDRAIRENQEKKFLKDIEKIKVRFFKPPLIGW